MSTSRSLIQFDNTKDLAAWYDQKYTEMNGGWSMMRETAMDIFNFIDRENSIRPQTLLDVGCGEGYFADFANSVGFASMGIDCSPVIIEKAKDRFPNVFFVVADIETLSTPTLFDVITSVGSIEHCIDINKALKNIYSILDQDGVFYALVPNELWIHMDQPQEQTHTDEEWSVIFKSAGFEIEKHRRNNDLSEFLLTKRR